MDIDKCSSNGKTCFDSETEAISAMRAINLSNSGHRRGKKHGKIERVYLCPHCDKWHLTSKVDYMIKKEIKPKRLKYYKKFLKFINRGQDAEHK